MSFPQLVVRRSTLDLDCEDSRHAAARLRGRVMSDAQLRYGAEDATEDASSGASASELVSKTRTSSSVSTCISSCGLEELDWATDESGDDERTTLMFRNLPRSYTRSSLQRLLDSQGFGGSYCFLYVPTDFKSLATNGYAFIGFSDNAAAARAKRHFQGFSRWGEGCRKRCNTAWSGAVQGLEEHIERYRNSSVMHPSVPDELKPAIFVAGLRVPFPMPTREVAPPSFRFSISGDVAAPHFDQR